MSACSIRYILEFFHYDGLNVILYENENKYLVPVSEIHSNEQKKNRGFTNQGIQLGWSTSPVKSLKSPKINNTCIHQIILLLPEYYQKVHTVFRLMCDLTIFF